MPDLEDPTSHFLRLNTKIAPAAMMTMTATAAAKSSIGSCPVGGACVVVRVSVSLGVVCIVVWAAVVCVGVEAVT